jgi:hypothetical protein
MLSNIQQQLIIYFEQLRDRCKPDEQKFHDFWLGDVKIVESVEDAYRAVGAIK